MAQEQPRFACTSIEIEVEVIDSVALEDSALKFNADGSLVSSGSPDHNDTDHKVANAIAHSFPTEEINGKLAQAGLKILKVSFSPHIREKPEDDHYMSRPPRPARSNDGELPL